jgi:uracil-DNA glycosylase
LAEILTAKLRRALSERVRYYNQLGIYDFYRRETPVSDSSDFAASAKAALAPSQQLLSEPLQPQPREAMPARKTAFVPVVPQEDEDIVDAISAEPEPEASDAMAALKVIRQDLGDCTRCRLSQGRTHIVFGVGNPRAELMFVGEGPGADEDAQGEPFVGRAGQLLNNMIKAMGLGREEVYIANVVKCRPPGNRTPERDECDTCLPFLMRQIAVIKPKVIVALGATAAKNLLAMNSPMAELRGRFYDFLPTGVRSLDPSWPGARLAVTYHPAFLLRDPRQKGEAWKDLQMVMKYLGIEAPPKRPQ